MNAGCKPYMPPERIEGEKKVAYDVRADVWSLGITLVRTSILMYPNYTIEFRCYSSFYLDQIINFFVIVRFQNLN